MNIKNILRSVILVCFGVYFFQTIIFGQRGIKKYLELKNEINFEKNKILKVENKIKKFQEKIDDWQRGDFELEKVAREELQMGLADEKVYILK